MLLETLFVALWANAVWLLDALAELWFDGQLCFHWCFGGGYSDIAFSFFNIYIYIFCSFSRSLYFIVLLFLCRGI